MKELAKQIAEGKLLPNFDLADNIEIYLNQAFREGYELAKQDIADSYMYGNKGVF